MINKEVALIGKGAGKEFAPLKGNGVDTWGVNDLVAHRECDVCFFMDRDLIKGGVMDTLVTTSVNFTNTPLYATKKFDDIPTSIEYPKSDIVNYFGTDYFADSCAYMIAMAIFKEYEKISMYGFNYSYGSKYVQEKPCVSFWLGVALKSGIKLNIHERSSLLKTVDGNMYAYEEVQAQFRDNISCLPFVPKGGCMKFGIRDRVAAIGVLPLKGSYTMLKMSQRLRKELMFNEHDAKKINLRQIDFQGKPMMIWDDNDLPDKDIELTGEETEIFSRILRDMDRNGGLALEHMGLYEKFCEE
jgi:hypothetical protein